MAEKLSKSQIIKRTLIGYPVLIVLTSPAWTAFLGLEELYMFLFKLFFGGVVLLILVMTTYLAFMFGSILFEDVKGDN